MTKLENQKKYRLGISVEKLSTSVEFTPLDVTVPTVKSVEALGTKKVVITFSEPVDDTTALTRINYLINGYVINGELSINKNKDAVTISLYSPLKAGENKISVTGVKDFAGMTIVNYLGQPFTVVEDTTEPASFTIESATLEYVDITFNEAIDPNSVDIANIYWSDNAGVTKHWATDVYPISADFKSYEIDFTGDRLPAKPTTLYIENVADMSENEAAKLTAVVTAIVDTERPDVISVDFAKDPNTGLYLYGNNQIEVKFNKVITLDQFAGENVTNITVKNTLGQIVAVVDSADYKYVNGVPMMDTIVVKLTSALSDSKSYTVEIANVVDNTVLANKMIPEKFTLVALAQTLPTVTDVFVHQIEGVATKIQIVFSNEMTISGEKSILDRNKYMIQIDDDKWYPISSLASLEPTYNNMAVVISIPSGIKYDGVHDIMGANITKIKVTYVSDKHGNMLEGYTCEMGRSENESATMINEDDSDYYPTAIAKDTIIVTFDRPLQYVNYKDFVVEDSAHNSYKVTKALYETVDGKGVVTLKISSTTKLPADIAAKEVIVKTVSENTSSIDILGNKIAVNTAGVNLADEIAPSLKTVDANGDAMDPIIVDNNTIVLHFDEELWTPIVTNPQALAASFIVTYGYNNKQFVAGSEYTAEISGSDVIITIKKPGISGETIKVATNGKYVAIYDFAVPGMYPYCNKISFTTKTVKNGNLIDTKAPTVKEVKYNLATEKTYKQDDKITIIFSEKIDASKFEVIAGGEDANLGAATITPTTGNVNEIVITLGSDTVLVSGNTLTINKKVEDTSKNTMTDNYVITLP